MTGLATVLLCALSCSARAQQVELVERLADTSWVIRLDGVEHRALNPAQMRQLLKDKAELESLRQQVITLQEQLTAYAVIKDLFEHDRAAADEQINALRQQTVMLEKRIAETDALLKQAVAVAKKGRLAAFFDQPAVAITLKLIPLAVAIVGAR